MIFSAVKNQFDKMTEKGKLYEVDLDKDYLWQLYLDSFPPGTNPLYKKRTAHDCSCCRSFIKSVGGAVIIESGKLVSVWDVQVDDFFQEIADALAKYVKGRQIVTPYSYRFTLAGAETSHQQLESGEVLKWEHFWCKVPKEYTKVSPSSLSDTRSTVDVFKRGIKEITLEAVDTVLDLIKENALYRGEEFSESVASFAQLKRDWKGDDLFFWENLGKKGARIRNTVIGTLLQDISEGYDVEDAVKSYENKVAPTNYKRPTALITKRMVDDAMKIVAEMGIEDAFSRRFATAEDISVNNVIWADRGTKQIMKNNLAAALMEEVVPDRKWDGASEIGIEDFIGKIVPETKTMEVMLEGRHMGNMVSLIAPASALAPQLFRWDNPFSWSYRGNVTDSIKERVKKAGGRVEAFVRVSLAWFNHDDLDLHVIDGAGFHIYFGSKISLPTGGFLDVDMNAGGNMSRTPVENIAWRHADTMKKGVYKVWVHNFYKREHVDVGFDLEMETEGVLHFFSYPRGVTHHEEIPVFEFTFDGKRVTKIEIAKGIEASAREQDVWGIKTGQFHKVEMLTFSPNHWDDNRVGNRHYFFMLEKCLNDERPRGFYNEYLRPELEKHRKVFEVLGDKTKCEMQARQLNGLGFSTTRRDAVICRCNNRVYKVLV